MNPGSLCFIPVKKIAIVSSMLRTLQAQVAYLQIPFATDMGEENHINKEVASQTLASVPSKVFPTLSITTAPTAQ